MKLQKKVILGIAALVLLCGMVLAACANGEYEANGVTIKLESGHKYTISGNYSDSGTWKKSGKTIIFTSDKYHTVSVGTLDGKELIVNDRIYKKKSAANEETVVEIEFADDLSADEIHEFFE